MHGTLHHGLSPSTFQMIGGPNTHGATATTAMH